MSERQRHEIDQRRGGCWCGSSHSWELAKHGYCRCTNPRCADVHMGEPVAVSDDECENCALCAERRAERMTDFASRLMEVAGRMFICEHCGNKRCPHATDHRLACTRSNEPNQPGSRYQYGCEEPVSPGSEEQP